MQPSTISAIVPTIGRPESLRNLLQSLSIQTAKVGEVIIADASSTNETEIVLNDSRWQSEGLIIHHLRVQPPNAVRQREAAINRAEGELLLLLDDDVVLEPFCVERMLQVLMRASDVVAVVANFNNQIWPSPTKPWHLYMRYVLRLSEGEWQGRVVGPLLRFGYYLTTMVPQPMEWLGTGNSLMRRTAFHKAGGFSDFFLHRCTFNEDVDLGIKLSRLGRILFCPTACMSHFHAPEGRVSPLTIAEDDLHNRFFILHNTVGLSKTQAFRLVALYHLVETISDLFGIVRCKAPISRLKRLWGRMRAIGIILRKLFQNNQNTCAGSLPLGRE